MTARKPTPTNILDDILGPVTPAAPSAHVSTETGTRQGGALHLVELDRILDNPYQQRQEDDVQHILGIATSMARLKAQLPATLGMQQPPTGRLVRVYDGSQVEPLDAVVYKNERMVREALADDATRVQLHFGHSRRQAFRVLADGVGAVWPELVGNIDGPPLDADYARMPLFLAHADKRTMYIHVATENAQRKDLSAVEEALLLRQAIDEFGMSTEDAARIYGWARSTAANKLRLLDLPADVQKMVVRGTVTERAARELCRLIDSPTQLAGALELITKGDGVSIGRLTSDVNWRVDTIKRERKLAEERQAAAAVLAAGWEPWPGAGVLPGDRLGFADGVNEWQHEVFTTGSEACAVCTAACPCMRVVQRQVGGTTVRPDPQAAPSMGLACSDSRRQRDLLAARAAVVAADPQLAADAQAAQAAQAQAAAEAARLAEERRQRLETNRLESDALWAEFLSHLNRPALWSSLHFWKLVAEHVWSLRETLGSAETEVAAVDALLEQMRYRACREYDRDLQEWQIDLGKLKELIAALENRKRKQPA